MFIERSPNAEVYWAGWSSTTRALQAQGWEFAVETDVYRERHRLLLRHRQLGWTGFAETRDDRYVNRVLGSSMEFSDPYYNGTPSFHVTHMTTDKQVMVHGKLDLMRVSMQPEMVEMPSFQPWRWDHVFRPWAPEGRDIIVAPESVAELMERITRLQEPELQEIRERNRLREGAQERVHAQIICIAA